VVANSSNFAGHVHVEDHVKIGGVCSFNQFVNIGAHAYIAGESSVNKDIIPFTIARGNYAVSTVTNKIGLERAGFSKEEIAGVHRAVRSVLKGSETIEKAIETILEQVEGEPNKLVKHLIEFIQKSERGVAR
jgi:UDP-N-acetylglucosamine acyltransferase